MDYSIYRYPVSLDMRARQCLIVGGGRVAERKARSLILAGAQVTIIATKVTATIQAWSEERKCKILLREYRQGDVQKAFMVIAATDNSSVNAAVAAEATHNNCLLNVIDNPSLGNFAVLGTLRLGLLSFSVFGGGNPLLTRLLLKDLEQRYGVNLSAFVEFLTSARAQFKQVEPDAQHRTAFWRKTLTSEQLECILQGQVEEVKESIKHAIDGYRSQS